MDIRSRKSAWPAVAAVVLAAALGAACDINVGNGDFSVGVASGKAQDEWTRSYDVKPGARIQIINVNGKIDVALSDTGKFDVRAERIAKARTDEAARAVLEKLDIVETASADGVKLQTKTRERLSMGQSQEVRYHLKVPAGVDLDLQTVNGAVDVQSVKASLVVATTNGSVKGHGLVGHVDASTTNGPIDLELASIDADVKAETVNGPVRLAIPETAKADISARCVNGTIVVDSLNFEPGAERSRRKLEARLNGGGSKIRIDTTNGPIRISGKS